MPVVGDTTYILYTIFELTNYKLLFIGMDMNSSRFFITTVCIRRLQVLRRDAGVARLPRIPHFNDINRRCCRKKNIFELKLTHPLYKFCIHEMFERSFSLCFQSAYRSLGTLNGCKFACDELNVIRV